MGDRTAAATHGRCATAGGGGAAGGTLANGLRVHELSGVVAFGKESCLGPDAGFSGYVFMNGVVRILSGYQTSW